MSGHQVATGFSVTTDAVYVRVSSLPPADRIIQPHWTDGAHRLCVWSRVRVTREILACPNGCRDAKITTPDPGITVAAVTDALADCVDEREIVETLGIVRPGTEWVDKITIAGHPHRTDQLILTLRDTGQEFVITVAETP